MFKRAIIGNFSLLSSALGEREDLKITVYHKSSIIDEFIGRIVINVSELSFEHNKSFTK